MPTNPEAPRLNLEYYRKQAKALLRQARSAEPSAVQRLLRNCPHYKEAGTVETSSVALHEAQLTVAREQGFPSWPRLRAFLEQTNPESWDLAQEFAGKAIADLRLAEEIRRRAPQVAHGGFYPALVLGDAAAVGRVLREDPSLAHAAGGPSRCQPLLYVCFSRYNRRRTGRADALAETARVLLAAGADPNAAMVTEDSPDHPLTCIYAASGLNNNPALTRLLLEAGADPNDNECVYHSTEHPDLECLRLLLAHGARAAGTNALKHMLDREDPEGVRLLLDAGAMPDEVNGRGETALHWAVWRGRSAGIVAALLDAGGTPDARRHDGRTAYALAVQSGQTATAELLRARGADTAVTPLDEFLAACQTASLEELQKRLTAAPELLTAGSERLLPDLTISHRTAAVQALLAAGAPVDAPGESGGTALHWACWRGFGDIARILLEHGASLTATDTSFHGTPAGWFGHGSKYCEAGDGDYLAVAQALLDYGAAIPAADLPTGRPEVDALLRSRGLIA